MIIVLVAALGLVFGSFINALVWRLRQQDKLAAPDDPDTVVIPAKAGIQSKKSLSDTAFGRTSHLAPRASKTEDYSIMHGRSMCPSCHHTLAAKDLVPLFSWLSLRGKCRYCHKPISWQYPFIELLTATLFAVSYLLWPLEFDTFGIVRFALLLVYVVFFVALSVYDWHWQELPDRLVWPLVGIAVTEAVLIAVWQQNIRSALIALLAGGILFGLFWLIFQISKGNWIGGGDVKLVLALGIIVGTPLNGFLVIFIASLIGTIASLPTLLRHKTARNVHVPFGPALLLAAYIVYFAGESLVSWYQGLLY